MAGEGESTPISALKQRNRTAWSLVVDRHSREVYGFVFHLVGRNRSIAEELTQETWLEAVDGIDKCDLAKGTFRNWLFGIARNRVAMHYRRLEATRNPRPLGDRGEQLPDPDPHATLPDEALERVEQHGVVRAALLLLPDDRREVMLAKYVEGLSMKSIAARTGKTVKAVESLLTRARQQLRSLLHEYMVPRSEGRLATEEAKNE